MRRLSVVIACPGVGHVVRGFESFAAECFEALAPRADLEVHLVGGRGPETPGRLTAAVPAPEDPRARLAGRLLRRDAYVGQQVLFALAMWPIVRSLRPDVIMISDWVAAAGLGRLRRVGAGSYRLLLVNGAAGGPVFDREIDHVQHLTPASLDVALAGGGSPEHHTLLPLGVGVPETLPALDPGARGALRERLGLPARGEILLCVAALNTWAKRLPYLIEEVASLERRPHLVLLGQSEEETPEILRLARDRLGADGHTVGAVGRHGVSDYYLAADAVVLPSLYEAFGRVLVESHGHGVPTLAHDAPWARYVLGEGGFFGDFGEPGGLAATFERVRDHDGGPAAREARHRDARARFAWDRLAPAYLDMLRACAG